MAVHGTLQLSNQTNEHPYMELQRELERYNPLVYIAPAQILYRALRQFLPVLLILYNKNENQNEEHHRSLWAHGLKDSSLLQNDLRQSFFPAQVLPQYAYSVAYPALYLSVNLLEHSRQI